MPSIILPDSVLGCLSVAATSCTSCVKPLHGCAQTAAQQHAQRAARERELSQQLEAAEAVASAARQVGVSPRVGGGGCLGFILLACG